MFKPISTTEAIELLSTTGNDIYRLFNRAHEVRLATRSNLVNLCGIVNAKSGRCTEDCKFCAQSAHNDVEVNCYKLLDAKSITHSAEKSQGHKASRFGIVTSGLAVTEESEIEEISAAIRRIQSDLEVKPCASLGNVSKKNLRRLKDAGLTRYHCNLETAESFYPKICSTRDWKDAKETIRAAQEVGLATCCGGLFGLGESVPSE